MLKNAGMSPSTQLAKETVAVILRRCATGIVAGWLARAKQSNELNCVPLSDEERTGHLPQLVEDLAVRLIKSSASAQE
jgi:hypothetical protein